VSVACGRAADAGDGVASGSRDAVGARVPGCRRVAGRSLVREIGLVPGDMPGVASRSRA